MMSMLPCSRSGIATVLCATDLTVTFSPALVKNPSLIATCSPAVSSTGSAPTTMLVIAAALLLGELVPEALLEALAEGVLELLLEVLQAVTRIAVAARAAATTGTRLARVDFIILLYRWTRLEWRSAPDGADRFY